MDEQLCIVLKANDYRDNDKMVTLFSRTSGRISCLARGVKSPKSHNASAVQMLCCGLYQFGDKNGRRFLSHAEIKKNYATIASDYDAFIGACSLLSFTDRLLDVVTEYDDLFILLVNCVNALSLKVRVTEVKAYYIVRLLNILGFFPSFDECGICGRPVSVPMFFSYDEGGLVCSDCSRHVHTVRISEKQAGAMVSMASTRPVDFKGCPEADESLLDGLVRYLKIMTDFDFR